MVRSRNGGELELIGRGSGSEQRRKASCSKEKHAAASGGSRSPAVGGERERAAEEGEKVATEGDFSGDGEANKNPPINKSIILLDLELTIMPSQFSRVNIT